VPVLGSPEQLLRCDPYVGLRDPVEERIAGEKDAPRLESTQMCFTYTWWRRVVVSYVIVGDVNLVRVL
jgi:hypothetical protein